MNIMQDDIMDQLVRKQVLLIIKKDKTYEEERELGIIRAEINDLVMNSVLEKLNGLRSVIDCRRRTMVVK